MLSPAVILKTPARFLGILNEQIFAHCLAAGTAPSIARTAQFSVFATPHFDVCRSAWFGAPFAMAHNG